MAGQQSAGFDLVMEFSEQPLRDIFGVVFDTSDFLCQLLDATLNQLPGVDIPCEGFSISVSLDRPLDLGLTPAQTDAVDIQLSHTVGLIDWRVRIVAGVSVDRSASNLDVVKLDLQNRLYHVEATFAGLPLDVSSLATNLRQQVRSIPLLMVTVDRTTTNDLIVKQVDAKVIDQIGTGENAIACCFTFGRGNPGSLGALTQSVVESGDTGTLMVGFAWLLRQMEPAVESGLGIPADAFVDGHLTRSVVIDAEEDVRMTNLDFALADGFIQVTTRVEKSGFCYSASASFGGKFRIAVEGGKLQVAADLTDPDVDLDIPWYCWIGAAFLGGLLAGIIGAVVVPVILYLVTSTVEGVVDRVADNIVNALNAVTPSAEVEAVGFNLVFQRAFVDDVGIGCRVKVNDTAPVRCEGTVRLQPGRSLDLDNGRVESGLFDGADVQWLGNEDDARLISVCSARLASTSTVRFDEVLRHQLYGLVFTQGRVLGVHELGFYEHIDMPFDLDIEWFAPSLEVFAVRTNERRYALMQVIDVGKDGVLLRYRTYGVRDPVVQIRGGFVCPAVTQPAPVVDRYKIASNIRFEPPRQPNLADTIGRLPALARRTVAERSTRLARQTDRGDTAAPGPTLRQRARLEELSILEEKLGPSANLRLRSGGAEVAVSATQVLEAARGGRLSLSESIGRWVGTVELARGPTGTFQALADGLDGWRGVSWWVNDVLLDPQAPSTEVDGVVYAHAQSGRRLRLEPRAKTAYEFELRVAVEDRNGKRFTTSTCVRYTGECSRDVRAVPHWTRFKGLVSMPR